MNNRKILIYNQYYSPLNNPPAKRLTGLAEYLTEKGWNVTVVTGMPNYPDGVFKKGYRKVFKRETLNGVEIYRTGELPLKNEGITKRLANYLSFALTSLVTIPLILTKSVVVISTPPLISAIPYFYICKLFRKKVILDIRDLWPESLNEVVGVREGLIYKIFLHISNNMYRRADSVVCVTNLMAKNVETRIEQTVNVVTNFAKSKKIRELDIPITTGDKISIAYTGIITKIQNLEGYLLLNTDDEIKNKYEWHIVGEGEELGGLMSLCKKMGFDNVLFYGYRSKAFCDKVINGCDCCLAGLKPSNLAKMMLPSKFIEYSSLGKPIIANASKEMENYITEYCSGLFVDFADIDKTKSAMKNLTKENLRTASRNSLRMFCNEFDSRLVLENYYRLISNV